MISPSRIVLIVVAYCFVLPHTMTAQFASFVISGDGYRGDLNRQGGVNGVNIAVGYSYYLEEGLFLKAQLGTGSFSSEFKLGNGTVFPNEIPDNFSPTLYFENRHTGADVSLNYEFFSFEPVSFYCGMGIGFMAFRLFDRTGKRLEQQESSRLTGETLDGLAFTAPLSLGVILFTTSKAQIAMEQQWVLTNSDYLDNIGYAGTRGADMLVRSSVVVRLGF